MVTAFLLTNARSASATTGVASHVIKSFCKIVQKKRCGLTINSHGLNYNWLNFKYLRGHGIFCFLQSQHLLLQGLPEECCSGNSME